MTVATVLGLATDGQLQSFSATYLTARAGGGSFNTDTASTSFTTGQEKFTTNYYCYEGFLDFDTTAIPANATISSAVLTMVPAGVQSGGSSAAIHKARLYDWGASLTSADYVAGASLTSLPLLAHIAQTSCANGVAIDFLDDAFAANVVKAGHTRILIASDRLEDATAPTGTEYVSWRSTDFTGTSSDPKLVITYTVPAGGSQAVVVV